MIRLSLLVLSLFAFVLSQNSGSSQQSGGTIAGRSSSSRSSTLTACQEHRRREEGTRGTPSVTGRLIPECDENGDYKGLQCHGVSTNGRRFCQCWDKDGTIVTSPSQRTTSCDCHLARHAVTNPPGGRRLVGSMAPSCNRDGTYASRQCHGSTGLCWCADANGNQVGNSTRDAASLDC
ncbi:U24-ctenitoxin-Pn1a [Halotydeus destructor]|nr:U24-ctenitoxin-Pn1a [Halotydeus destructor]